MDGVGVLVGGGERGGLLYGLSPQSWAVKVGSGARGGTVLLHEARCMTRLYRIVIHMHGLLNSKD